jgi:CelD/BcsL family acetyltransferase involved in cellulose biosynthesis
LSLDVVRPSELGRAELDAWAGLQFLNPDLQSPFLSPGWARAVERAQGPGAGAKVVLASTGGVIQAVLPVCAGRVTAWPIGAPMCDTQGLIAEPGYACDPRALVRALGVQRFDFTHMVGEASPFVPFAQGEDVAYVTDLSEGFDAWAASRKAMGSGLIKDLAKRRRKLEKDFGPVRFTALSTDRSAFDQLIAWKRRRFADTRQTDIFDAGWTLALVRDLWDHPGEGARAGLFTLHAGETLVAAQLHLMSETCVMGWLVAHGEEAEQCAPGRLLFEDLLRWMDGRYRELDNGLCDFGFKSRFANRLRPLRHGFVGASPAGLVRAAEYGVRRAAERLPLGRASAWPGKAMRRMDLWRTLKAGEASAHHPQV